MNTNEVVSLVNVKTGKHCRKRIAIFNLWDKDPGAETRAGGWMIAREGKASTGEFTDAIAAKVAATPIVEAPVVKKKDADVAIKDVNTPIVEDNPNVIAPDPVAPENKTVAKAPAKRPAAKRKPTAKTKK